MKSKKITGQSTFIQLGTGFWAIISEDGTQYRPLVMPDQLKTEGKKIKCRVKEVQEEISIFMSGIPVVLVSFET